MSRYKAIIVDDERLARQRIVGFLSEFEDNIEIIGQADNGKTAVALIDELQPELVFLDIQLPDMTGFEVLSNVSYRPKIIFTTAYQEYAVKAFEELSIDYLVKPITNERFAQAIKKLNELQVHDVDVSMEEIISMVNSHKSGKKNTSLPVKKGNKIILVDYEDISYLQAEDKYVTINLIDGGSYITDKTIKELDLLIPSEFVRIHRSYIVNKSCISEIERYFKGTLILTLNDKQKTRLKTSESYSSDVKKVLGI